MKHLLRTGFAFLLAGWLAGPVAGDAEGIRLVGDFNCTACHTATEPQARWIRPQQAPRLAGLGSRISPAWLRQYLSSPSTALPGTTMPDVLQAIPEPQRTETVEALVHFLVAANAAEFHRTFSDRAAVARGESLYHQIGCVACHDPQNPAAKLASSVPLPDLTSKWSLEGLRRFLRDPLATRPSGRMPALNLSEREANDLAHYLLRDTHVPAPLEVSEFRGRIEALEELDSADLVRTGPAQQFSLANRERAPRRFSGWLEISVAGEYRFHLTATGASRLSVADGWRVGQDSWQREFVNGSATLRLDPGWYPIVLDHVPRGPKDPDLRLEWEGPGIARAIIPESRLRSTREFVPVPPTFQPDPEKVRQGREHYTQLHCGNCHDSGPQTSFAPALAALQPDQGCLAERPSKSAPNFALTTHQQALLKAALTTLNQPGLTAPSPRELLAGTLTSFRCLACHVRDGTGGVTADRDPYFTSNGTDLGEEGRLPPRLDGVGDKLQPAWLSNVLVNAVSVRPYLNTRMPQFGPANVGHLAAQFVALDRHATELVPAPDEIGPQREAGRQLIGTDGLSCIACHRFNRQPAHALQVLDLTTTTQRLNEDWFRRFLLDPSRYNAGTRMPAFWPDGVSPLPGLLGGSPNRQFAALWTYLADGAAAKFPEGLSRENVELIVGGEAVVYRGKLWEAGFRAVAVGFPGQINAAFDAEELRLALIWRGRFLNAGPHWTVQGMGQIRPLGTDVVIFPHGTALAVLPAKDSPWPTESARAAGLKFRGYQLDAAQRPLLLYSLGAVEVEDFLSPRQREGPVGIHRQLTFTGPIPAGLHLRLATGDLTAQSETRFQLPAGLTLEVTGGAKAFLRGDGGTRELLVPIPTGPTTQRLEVNYVW